MSPSTEDIHFLEGGGQMGALMRAHDWARSPLGRPASWPSALKTAVSICLNSRFPMVLWWGPEFIMLYNDAWRPVLGETKHPGGLGRPGRESWPEIWDIIGSQLNSVLRSGEATWSNDLLLVVDRNKYREEAYFTYSYSPIKDVHGRVGGVFSAVSETTERVLSERRLRILRDLSTEATQATAEGRSVGATCEAFAATLGRDHPDIPFAALYLAEDDGIRLVASTGVGEGTFPTFISPDADDKWSMWAVLRKNEPVVTDASANHVPLPGGVWPEPARQVIGLPVAKTGQGAGATGVLLAGVNPRRAPDQAYRDFFGLVAGQLATNITNARAYEEERKRAEVLVELDRAKTTFFSNVSHEFRTPLTLMLGPLEDLLSHKHALGGDELALAGLAHRNGMRLLKLVNALLDFSRIEAGRTAANFAATDLAEFTAELASAFRSAVDRAGLRLIVDCSPLSQPVYVDREMWEKIVLNLLSNAFKFTFQGSIGVTTRESPGRSAAEVRVFDTGIGIPPNELPTVFERFRRVEGARGRSIEGSGIGLALVQELVKQHGGSITVESQVNRGSTFTILLPYGTSHLPPQRVNENAQFASASARAQAYVEEALGWIAGESTHTNAPAASGVEDLGIAVASAPKGQTILLADDNADMRRYVERLLRSGGYDVVAVGDGEAALARVAEVAPALVLADVMMPKLDGFGLLESVRSAPAIANTPFIMLSARAGEEAKIEGLQAGADDYLTKPFAARELLTRVETNIKLANLRKQAAAVLREEAETLRLLNRVGEAIAAELDFTAIVQLVTDTATQLSGAKFGAFFYNTETPDGGAYTLYTLSGARREDFAGFPMPRNTDVFGLTFRGEGVVRSDDITTDPRYGKNAPHHGMPKGHLPVRSYLAAPVVSKGGEVLGGLFFGHPERGIFNERAERIVATIAVQAAVALEKAKLYRAAQTEIDRRKEMEAVLRDSERRLEQAVAERTEELRVANERLTAEAGERQEAERRLRLLVDGIRDHAIFMLDAQGMITSWNAGAERIKGYSASEIIGKHYSIFYPTDDRQVGVPHRALAKAAESGKYEAEGWRVRKDGSRFRASVVLSAIRDNTGSLVGYAKITRDVTERRRAEEALKRAQEQLAQAQKMEGIGQLTGGVAHDFNNLLTVIIGNLEASQRGLQVLEGDTSRIARSLENAMRGAQRGATLTQRLLAFSRRQPLDPKTVDVGKLVSGMSDLLRRTIGEQIIVETVLAGGLWRAYIDPNQLEVAILNLAVNARDAMPNGGKLTIETANAFLDEGYAASQAEVVPGQYVVLCISDTGSGMTPEVMARAFEPFFTTKEIGQGTGLGLSQVYGFIKQSGGHVKLYSEPAQGTTVKLYLPRLLANEESIEDTAEQVAPRSLGHEVVLVVEDDPDVREYTKDILGELGYETLLASDGSEALRLLQQRSDVDVLFTDVGLPGGMNGRQLGDRARSMRPDLKILFTTGYARNAIVHEGRLDPGVQLITKPFTYAELAAKLSDVLTARGESPRVLLVEDEVLVQMLASEQLQELGYKVDTATTAVDALSKAKLMHGQFYAAVIDFGLPDRKGDALVRELRALYPNLLIVIATGYDEQELRAKFSGDLRLRFLSKPYTREAMEMVLASPTDR